MPVDSLAIFFEMPYIDDKGGSIMSKQYRGKALWKLPSRGRGTCPVCKAGRIKLLYEMILGSGDKIKVCKRCKSKKVESI